jgi:hypothetical protein
MAHQAPIAGWLLAKRDQFDVRIREYPWPARFGLSLSEFEIELSWKGQVFVGRGADPSEDIALEKAAAEAIERAICRHHNIKTTGVAVHTNLQVAIRNARLEYIERTIFWSHLDKNIPFSFAEAKEVRIDRLDTSSARAAFYFMSPVLLLNSLICIIEYGLKSFLGMATSQSHSESVTRSFVEASRNLAAFLSDSTQYESDVVANPDLWSGDSSFIEGRIRPLLVQTSMTMPVIAIHEPIVAQLSLPGELAFENCPAIAVRAAKDDGK